MYIKDKKAFVMCYYKGFFILKESIIYSTISIFRVTNAPFDANL